MQDSLDYVEAENTGTPVFLKVLCILTFVGAGLGFLGGIWTFFTVQNTFGAFANLPGLNMFQGMEEYIFWAKLQAGAQMICNLLCIVGAVLMMQLKKVGYFMYLGGEIVPLFFAFMVASKQAEMMSSIGSGIMPFGGGMMSSLTWAGLIFQVIFVVAFVIMYSVNLKHLKK
jgi:hypothetical protein